MNRFFWPTAAMLLAVAAVPTACAEESQGALAPRVMFVAFRVADLERSLHFYTQILGMREYGRYPGEGSQKDVALTFATDVGGAEPTDSGAMLLLIPREAGAGPVQHGDAHSRIALGVPDVPGVVASAKQAGHEVTREPTRIADGNRWVAFVRDPDGYHLELLGPATPGS